jgi:hypothetical protein
MSVKPYLDRSDWLGMQFATQKKKHDFQSMELPAHEILAPYLHPGSSGGAAESPEGWARALPARKHIRSILLATAFEPP